MATTNKEALILAGDIGGTKTNLGLFVRGKRRPILKVSEKYASPEAPNLEDIIDRFLSVHRVSVANACFGVAGPVESGRCKTINLPWYVSEKKLKNRYGWDGVLVVNDLTALAYAIPVLTKRDFFPLNLARTTILGNIGLIAPGTGLGTALIIWKDGRYVSVPSEAGHADFAPKNEAEANLWQYLRQRVGHVSTERVLSGPGLFIIYCWLKYTGQGTEPTWLSQKMKEGDLPKVIAEAALVHRDPLCINALNLFVSIFGTAAGNLALTGLTRGGIYLGGGIAPKILPKLREGLFMSAFVDKGRFSGLLSQIPVRVVLNDKATLIGAAVCALGQ